MSLRAECLACFCLSKMLTRGTMKPSGWGVYGTAGNAGVIVGGKWGPDGGRLEGKFDTDSFSTYFLNLEGVNFLY